MQRYPTTKIPEKVNPMTQKVDLHQAARFCGITHSLLTSMFYKGQLPQYLFHKEYLSAVNGSFRWMVQRGELEDLKAAVEKSRPGPVNIIKEDSRLSLAEIAQRLKVTKNDLHYIRVSGKWPEEYQGIERRLYAKGKPALMFDESVVDVLRDGIENKGWLKRQRIRKTPSKREWISLREIADKVNTTEASLYHRWQAGIWPKGIAHRKVKLSSGQNQHFFALAIVEALMPMLQPKPDKTEVSDNSEKQPVKKYRSQYGEGWYSLNEIATKILGVAPATIYRIYDDGCFPDHLRRKIGKTIKNLDVELFGDDTVEFLKDYRQHLEHEKQQTKSAMSDGWLTMKKLAEKTGLSHGSLSQRFWSRKNWPEGIRQRETKSNQGTKIWLFGPEAVEIFKNNPDLRRTQKPTATVSADSVYIPRTEVNEVKKDSQVAPNPTPPAGLSWTDVAVELVRMGQDVAALKVLREKVAPKKES